MQNDPRQKTEPSLQILFRGIPSELYRPRPLWLQTFARQAKKLLRTVDFLPYGVRLILVNAAIMEDLHRQFLAKPWPTDILTFPKEPPDPSLFAQLPADNDLRQAWLEGYVPEIFFCWPKLEQQAALYKLPIEQEALRLFVHGLAHLKGFQHETEEQEQQMLAFELGFLTELGLAKLYR